MEQNKYLSNDGLIEAINELKEIKTKTGKLPTSRMIAVRGITKAVRRGEWVDCGIRKGKFNDLLFMVFGEINLEINKYRGKKGLEILIKEMKVYRSKHQKLPNREKFTNGLGALNRGEWIKFGIRKGRFNDLLERAFGEINVEMNKYVGEESWKIAIVELLLFEKRMVGYQCQKIPKFRGYVVQFRKENG